MTNHQRLLRALGLALLLISAAVIALCARQIQILPEKMTEYYTAAPAAEGDDDMSLLLQMLNQ